MEVVITIDTSKGIGDAPLTEIKQAVIQIIEAIEREQSDSYILILELGDKGTGLINNWTNNYLELRAKINGFQANACETAEENYLKYFWKLCLEDPAPKGAHKRVGLPPFVFTDGAPEKTEFIDMTNEIDAIVWVGPTSCHKEGLQALAKRVHPAEKFVYCSDIMSRVTVLIERARVIAIATELIDEHHYEETPDRDLFTKQFESKTGRQPAEDELAGALWMIQGHIDMKIMAEKKKLQQKYWEQNNRQQLIKVAVDKLTQSNNNGHQFQEKNESQVSDNKPQQRELNEIQNDTFDRTAAVQREAEAVRNNMLNNIEKHLQQAEVLADLAQSNDTAIVLVKISYQNLGAGSKQYTLYNIELQFNGQTFTSSKRYSQFYGLFKSLSSSIRREFKDFPPKKSNKMDPLIIESRQNYFRDFLLRLMQIDRNSALKFVSTNEND